jgi:hypothetical protein
MKTKTNKAAAKNGGSKVEALPTIAEMLNKGTKLNFPARSNAIRITDGKNKAVVMRGEEDTLKGAIGVSAVVEFGMVPVKKGVPMRNLFITVAGTPKPAKTPKTAKKSEGKRGGDVAGLSVCGFCRAAGKSGLTIEQVLAVLTHYKAEHGGHTAANQRRWGVKGKDRNGVKIEGLTAEQLATIKPIIAKVKVAAKKS